MTSTVSRDSIKEQSKKLKEARFRVMAEEQRLSLMIWKYLKPRGSMRDLAKELSISAQCLCDIVHQRRKVSDAVIEKVIRL